MNANQKILDILISEMGVEAILNICTERIAAKKPAVVLKGKVTPKKVALSKSTPSSIKFYVRENEKMFPLSSMSEPEQFSIQQEVNGLLPKPKGTDFWFEVDTCLLDCEEEEPAYGLVCCFKQNPSPKNDSDMESKIPHPFPAEVLEKLYGSTHSVSPTQYGLNKWGNKVEILFENGTTSK